MLPADLVCSKGLPISNRAAKISGNSWEIWRLCTPSFLEEPDSASTKVLISVSWPAPQPSLARGLTMVPKLRTPVDTADFLFI